MPDTSIPIESETRDRLRGEKQGSETYSDTIERLIDERDRLKAELGVE